MFSTLKFYMEWKFWTRSYWFLRVAYFFYIFWFTKQNIWNIFSWKIPYFLSSTRGWVKIVYIIFLSMQLSYWFLQVNLLYGILILFYGRNTWTKISILNIVFQESLRSFLDGGCDFYNRSIMIPAVQSTLQTVNFFL